MRLLEGYRKKRRGSAIPQTRMAQTIEEAISRDAPMPSDNSFRDRAIREAKEFWEERERNPLEDFKGANVCLSGSFEFGSKKEIEKRLLAAGASVVKSPTLTLDYLVIGQKGNSQWIEGGKKGTKQKTVERHNAENNTRTKIVSEKDLLEKLDSATS